MTCSLSTCKVLETESQILHRRHATVWIEDSILCVCFAPRAGPDRLRRPSLREVQLRKRQVCTSHPPQRPTDCVCLHTLAQLYTDKTAALCKEWHF